MLFRSSKAKVEQLAKSADGGLSEFQKIYADYNITSCEAVYYEQTGWHIYLKMWKKKPKKQPAKKTAAGSRRKRKGKAGSRAQPVNGGGQGDVR